MMHHVAGDCLKPDALLQADILKTFLQIWDTELPITQVPALKHQMFICICSFFESIQFGPLATSHKHSDNGFQEEEHCIEPERLKVITNCFKYPHNMGL